MVRRGRRSFSACNTSNETRLCPVAQSMTSVDIAIVQSRWGCRVFVAKLAQCIGIVFQELPDQPNELPTNPAHCLVFPSPCLDPVIVGTHPLEESLIYLRPLRIALHGSPGREIDSTAQHAIPCTLWQRRCVDSHASLMTFRRPARVSTQFGGTFKIANAPDADQDLCGLDAAHRWNREEYPPFSGLSNELSDLGFDDLQMTLHHQQLVDELCLIQRQAAYAPRITRADAFLCQLWQSCECGIAGQPGLAVFSQLLQVGLADCRSRWIVAADLESGRAIGIFEDLKDLWKRFDGDGGEPVAVCQFIATQFAMSMHKTTESRGGLGEWQEAANLLALIGRLGTKGDLGMQNIGEVQCIDLVILLASHALLRLDLVDGDILAVESLNECLAIVAGALNEDSTVFQVDMVPDESQQGVEACFGIDKADYGAFSEVPIFRKERLRNNGSAVLREGNIDADAMQWWCGGYFDLLCNHSYP